MRTRALILLLLCASTIPGRAAAVTPGQIDDFEDGTRQNWRKGQTGATNTLTNITTGGPGGAGDNYLRSTSSGNPGSAGRAVFFNQAQWRGDYVAEAIAAIEVHVRNFGAAPLHLRVGIQGATPATKCVSTTAVAVPNDGQWHVVSLGIQEGDLTRVDGAASIAAALADVDVVRILSLQAAPGWQGDLVASDMGIDNITAAAATPVRRTTWGRIKALD
jgi:hypothetical protein